MEDNEVEVEESKIITWVCNHIILSFIGMYAFTLAGCFLIVDYLF